MSKKFKSQASSARAASALSGGFGFGSTFQTNSSALSYVTESPDLLQISDSNLVVAFKNLSKKDSTTKAKALEELQEFCVGDVEQAVLQAWADIYPRTSIDNSRRVRQLAHTLQGTLTVSAGKRIAPLLPKVIGSWLAGTFDSDKSVSRSAQDALERSFTTVEKRRALWSLYKDALFTYIEDATFIQTSATLSDERTTSVDDAQAKYVRVVGTAMNMLAELLRTGAQNDLIGSLLNGKKLWEFAYHDDPYLRRTACDLVVIASEKYANHLDWASISTCFLSKGLHSNQSGSSRQYSTSLLVITQRRPGLWTSDYNAKTAISRRLTQFLRQGSQNGPEDVWSNIAALIKIVPEEAWLNESRYESATNIVEAMRTGVNQPTERMNAAAAWATYARTCLWVAEGLSEGKEDFLGHQLVPIVQQYVTKKEEQQWSITARVVQISSRILSGIVQLGATSLFEATWSGLVSSTIDEMRLSQPETSNDFRSSQDTVIEQARRLYSVKTELLKTPEAAALRKFLEQSDNKIADAAIHLLRARNGKPYSAAGILEIIVSQPEFDRSQEMLQAFLQKDLVSLLMSPSSGRLASISLTCGQTGIIDSLLAQRSVNTDAALYDILKRVKPDDLSQQCVKRISDNSLSDDSGRQIMLAVMQNPTLHNLHSIVCERIQEATASTDLDLQQAALDLLEKLLTQPTSTGIIASDEFRPSLLSNLLVIADSNAELSDKSSAAIDKLNSRSQSGTGTISIIRHQLNGEGIPLSIFTLIDLANQAAQTKGIDLSALIPTSNMWDKALLPHLSSPRPFSLSITSPLQGTIYSLDRTNTQNGGALVRDHDDFSHAFRLILYTTRLLTSEVGPRITEENLQATYLSYPRALQLVNEKLTIDNANEIWVHSTPEVLQEASDVLSEGSKIIQLWVSNSNFVSYWIDIPKQLTNTDLATYITYLAWINILTLHVDQRGPSHLLQNFETELKTVHKSESLLRSAALLAVLRQYLTSAPFGKRIVNELVADVTELRGNNIESLVLVNILLQGEPDTLEIIPSQRLVFLLKNLVRLFHVSEVTGLQSETMKLLATLVPQVQDVYGDHWEQILEEMVNLWTTNEMDIPVIDSSVRLYTRLKSSVVAEEVNEDLQDAWGSAKPRLDAGLLECLRQLSYTVNDPDQPRTITAQLIRRQLRDVELKDGEDMFALLASPVEPVQSAAFEVLHRAIPQQQEQLSVELVLEKRVVEFPKNLIELLVENQNDHRKYLLSWKLTFDHFSGASYKLQEAYTAIIKDTGHIDALLNYTSEALRIVSGRPIDASKFDIVNFDIDEAESLDREIQWLVIHNYYNALRCVPTLTKEWFISQKNRVKTPLEVWTQKYISPLIVAASLATVTTWANAQSQDEDERPFVIKPSPRGSELTASISVDPESPPISLAITLPGSYPLESPSVTSRTRVGVSDKNWQSWLRTIQIIIFSTGSIIEGLVAFRRNVQGALRGQSECAICYSIIGTDMQTPNKKCGTCKNMFHGTCLFRWFKSSNSSSCPLCRNNFNYA